MRNKQCLASIACRNPTCTIFGHITGVTIRRGDWILGDEDGVVVIPAEALTQTIRLAREKVGGENLARAELARGVPMGEVFRKHGIL